MKYSACKRTPKANGGSLAAPREQLAVTSETRCDVSPSEVCFQPIGSVQPKGSSHASTREEVIADVFPGDNVGCASGHQQIHAWERGNQANAVPQSTKRPREGSAPGTAKTYPETWLQSARRADCGPNALVRLSGTRLDAWACGPSYRAPSVRV